MDQAMMRSLMEMTLDDRAGVVKQKRILGILSLDDPRVSTTDERTLGWARAPVRAVDVKRVDGVYVMVREGHDGTYWASSADGECWVDRGRLFGLGGGPDDQYGQVSDWSGVMG
jgi:hypothetical protein